MKGSWRFSTFLIGLGAAWLFVAVAFLHVRYAPINPIAMFGAWAFGAQGLALIGFGLWGFGSPADHRIPCWRAIVGTCFVALNLLSDILYRVLDPRSE